MSPYQTALRVITVCSALLFFNISLMAQAGSVTKTFPGSAVTIVPSGQPTFIWTNPQNIADENGLNAVSVIPQKNKRSYFLQATQFGFISGLAAGEIPPTASISGILVQIKKKGTNVLIDQSVLIMKAGVTAGITRASGSQWPAALTFINHGGSSDLWGTTWTVAQITAAGFGVQVQAKSRKSGSSTAEIDNIKITVYFNSTNYYSKSTGSLGTLATWGTNTDGTGSAPLNFTTDGQIFNLVNRAATTLDAPLTISGNGSKLVVGNGAAAMAFTVPATNAYSGLMDVKNVGTAILQNTSIPIPGTFDAGSEVNYNAAGNQNVAEANYSKLTISGGGIKTLLAGLSASTNVSGLLTVNSAVTFTINNPVSAEVNITNNGTINGTGEITQVGLVSATISGTGSFNALGVDNSAAGPIQVTLSGSINSINTFRCLSGNVDNATSFFPAVNCVVNIEDGSLDDPITSVNAYDVLYTSTISRNTSANELGGINLRNLDLNLLDNTLSVTMAANISITGNLTLTSGIFNSSNRIFSLGGNFTNNSVFTTATGTMTFTGTGIQDLSGTSQIIFNNLTLNKLSGRVQLLKDASINGITTLTAGIINTNNFTYTLNSNTASFNPAITLGAARTSFISTALADGSDGSIGGLQIQNIGPGGRTGNVVFPAGNSFTSYNPVQINNTGTNDNYTVAISAGTPPGSVAVNCVNRIWSVTEGTSGGSNAVMAMQWNIGDENANFLRLTSSVFHSTGTAVNATGTTGAAAGTDPYTRSSVTAFTIPFSRFGVGSDVTILPVKFTSVSAKVKSSGIEIKWTNSTESNVKDYTVEKSTDGIVFKDIQLQPAKYNNLAAANYISLDTEKFTGNVYYRIRAEELSGVKILSSIVKVSKTDSEFFTVAPNPVTGKIMYLQINSASAGKFVIQISDMSGRKVYNTVFSAASGLNNLSMNLPARIAPGLYMASLKSEVGKIMTEKILIK